jgi:tetratricopeptide (TPR) repeat protein
MAPTPPQLDEHGFPIPPTFEDGRSSRRRRASPRAILWLMLLVFVGLLAGGIARSGKWQDVKNWFAEMLLQRAQEKWLASGDIPGALADVEQAAAWSPDDPNIYELRALIRVEMKDLVGALEDYDRLIKFNGRYANAYRGRSQVYQRLNRHREAIDDLTQVIKLSSERDARSRNDRAYARAIAGVELEDALKDIEEALEYSAELRGTPDAPENANAAFLDTRGYLHLLLGRPKAAMTDLDQAIKVAEAEQQQAIRQSKHSRYPPAYQARILQQFAHNLAVMYHHRGQVHEALGQVAEAEADLRKGDQLGYNPEEGVY